MKNIEILQPDSYYHIYNRAVGSEKLFLADHDYGQFLQKWQYYISPIVKVYAYCLMPNHFHFLVRVNSIESVLKCLKNREESIGIGMSRRFSSFFSAYAMSFNYRYNRKGKLFMLPFKRKEVTSDSYFTQLVYYIHRNPLHHGILVDPGGWEYSSFPDLIDDNQTWIYRRDVHEWFGGKEAFINYHRYMNLLSA